jgi:hypothetical protein
MMDLTKKHWNIFEYSDDYDSHFSHNPMLGVRKQPNLNNLLCRAIVRYPTHPVKDTMKYFPKFCHRLATCNKRPLQITSTNKLFYSKWAPTSKLISCELKNFIYCITCKKCKAQYIGETSRPIRQRIYEYLYSITKQDHKHTPVSRHFDQPHHSVCDQEFTIIEDCNLLNCTNNPDNLRKRRELFWIWALKMVHPYGINMATTDYFHK